MSSSYSTVKGDCIMSREVAQATVELRARVDEFMSDFETEFRSQATKENRSSERRMRTLLREFRARVYEPYRDSTLAVESQDEL
jgi:hypothetical protein